MKRIYHRLRDPAYTGERRCSACTVVNFVLLSGICLSTFLVSPVLSIILAVGGGVIIVLRGYFIPFTPEFAPLLALRLPGNLFDHPQPAANSPQVSGPLTVRPGNTESTDDEQIGEAIVTDLLVAGVLEAEKGQLYLDDGFQEDWQTAIRKVRGFDDDRLATAVVESIPGAKEVEISRTDDSEWFVISDGSDDPAAEAWVNRAIVIAETAAVQELAQRAPELDAEFRPTAAQSLRAFLQSCPACGGDSEETTTEACCGGRPGSLKKPVQAVLACSECGQRLSLLPE